MLESVSCHVEVQSALLPNPMKVILQNKIYYSVRAAIDLGAIAGLQLAATLFSKASLRIKPRGYPHSFLVRGGTSDPLVFHSVFSKKEYQTPDRKNIDLILDLGANVGYSAIYFARHYPHAKILALEPDRRNFQLLCENVKPYGNIVPIERGVWWRKTKLNVANPKADSWAFRFEESDREGIDCTTIEALLEEYQSEKKIMVKMDVEGAEKEIFQKNPSWPSEIDYLQVEIHGCWKTVFDALSAYDYSASISGKNIVVKISRPARSPQPSPQSVAIER